MRILVFLPACPPWGFDPVAAFWLPLLELLGRPPHRVDVLLGHLQDAPQKKWGSLEFHAAGSGRETELVETAEIFMAGPSLAWKAARYAAAARKPLVVLGLSPDLDPSLPLDALLLVPCSWVLEKSGWRGPQMVVWPGCLPSRGQVRRLFLPGEEDWWNLMEARDAALLLPGHSPLPGAPLAASLLEAPAASVATPEAGTVFLGDIYRDAWAAVRAISTGAGCSVPDHPFFRSLLGRGAVYRKPGEAPGQDLPPAGAVLRRRPGVSELERALEALLFRDRGKKITVLASEPQYLRHMAPVWRGLPAEARGPVLAVSEQPARLAGLGVPVLPSDGYPVLDRGTPVLVASGNDLEPCRRQKLPTVLMEHGAGQTYSPGKNRGYAGGPGRESVILFLAPGPHPARRHREAWPASEVAEIGCPWLDGWIGQVPPRKNPPVVALAWHWDGRGVCPEASSGFRHFSPALPELARHFSLLGHGHPRILESLRPEYEKLGIEVVETAEEILERADLLVADNTSLLFEFAATGRPVVVLNPPQYRRHVEHGLRFWEAAGVGINCSSPQELVDTIFRALEDPPEAREGRRQALALVYSQLDGNSTARAVEAIMAALKRLPESEARPDAGPHGEAGMANMVEVEVRRPFDAGPGLGIVPVGTRYMEEESRALKLKERRLVYILGAVLDGEKAPSPEPATEAPLRPSPELPQDFPSQLLLVEEEASITAQEELAPPPELWCPHPGCGRGPFKTARGLEIHQRVHQKPAGKAG